MRIIETTGNYDWPFPCVVSINLADENFCHVSLYRKFRDNVKCLLIIVPKLPWTLGLEVDVECVYQARYIGHEEP
jgi:hypothetical protein